MHYDERSTVCVSSQAGCAMGCTFCATGQAGFDRQLTVGEIVEQVTRAGRRARDDGRRLSNVVFMGMGEPLANYDATWAAVERMHADLGLSARHLTVSTVGIVPGIRRLATEALPVNLAVSLHAADDTLRDELVPINRRYPLSTLMDACAGVPAGEGPTALLRMGADRRRERSRAGRPAARRTVPEPSAPRAREPDPAQPDAGLRGPRLTAEAVCGSSAIDSARVASTQRFGARAAPRSTPRVVSCGPRTRSMRRPWRCDRAAETASAWEHGDPAASAYAARELLVAVHTSIAPDDAPVEASLHDGAGLDDALAAAGEQVRLQVLPRRPAVDEGTVVAHDLAVAHRPGPPARTPRRGRMVSPPATGSRSTASGHRRSCWSAAARPRPTAGAARTPRPSRRRRRRGSPGTRHRRSPRARDGRRANRGADRARLRSPAGVPPRPSGGCPPRGGDPARGARGGGSPRRPRQTGELARGRGRRVGRCPRGTGPWVGAG